MRSMFSKLEHFVSNFRLLFSDKIQKKTLKTDKHVNKKNTQNINKAAFHQFLYATTSA